MLMPLFDLTMPPPGWIALAILGKVSLLVAIAWGATRILRRRSAALRHAIWAFTLAIAVVMPVVWPAVPKIEVPVPWLEAPLVPGAATSRTDGAPNHGILAAHPPPDAAVSAQVLDDLLEAGPLAASEVSDGHAGTSAGKFVLEMLLVWGAGAFLLFGRLAFDLLRVALITRRSITEAGSAGSRIAEEEQKRLKLKRRIRVRFTDEVEVPITWGLLRPVVLLPADAREWGHERLRVVILHELAHIRRWDYLVHLLSEVAACLYWPNPLVWIARGRLQMEQEQACDDYVIASGTRAYEYAEHLIAIATAAQVPRWSWGGAISMGRATSLKDRIRTILDERTNRSPLSPAAAALLFLALAVIVLPVVATVPGAPEPAPPADTAITEAESSPSEPEEALPTAEEEPANVYRYLWLEAEEGEIHAPMRVEGDPDAAGARAVQVPDGDGNDAPEGGPGRVVLPLQIELSGVYYIWARVIGPADNDNSFYVSMDGGHELPWHVLDERGRPEVHAWRWLPVGEWDDDARFETSAYELSAGTHTLQFRNREDGTRLDRVVVTNDASFVPHGRGPLPGNARPAYLWFEAEDVKLTDPMQAMPDPRASGQRFAATPRAAPRGDGLLILPFAVDEAGRYVIWARVRAPQSDQNSFFVSVDGAPEVIWDVPGFDERRTAERWTWDAVSSREKGAAEDPLVFDLDAGSHTLHLRNRESGTSIDGIFITNDLGYRPRGMRAVLPPSSPMHLTLEAERAALRDDEWEVVADETASGSAALRVDDRHRSLNEPPRSGRALFAFEVDRPGLYKVWGRVHAPDDDRDSFWVRMDGGRWIKWNSVDHGDGWRWVEVFDHDYGGEIVPFELTSGAHTLEFAFREGGTGLDRLLITNDPALTPGESGELLASEPSRNRVEVVFDPSP